ncbi:MAG: Flp pilus assembly complex ATPase component TadA, partial [Armatimonadetes bacterium]|nr:Flp pilus assembly complex ATPase component TadA [Armatimonadota bacterium]
MEQFPLTAEQVVVGKHANLVLGEESMALLTPSGAPATSRPSARYSEVAAITCNRGSVTVEFSTPGPAWQVAFHSTDEAVWVAEHLETRRAGAQAAAALGELKTVEALRSKLVELLSGTAPRIPAAATALVAGAALLGASDVHISPGREARITVRVDGRLSELCPVPEDAAAALVSRLKSMAGLPSYVSDEPLSGHITVEAGERSVDARLTTVAAGGGEAAALRILTRTWTELTIDKLGLEEAQLSLLRQAATQAGMVVLTGPAGAGKTTTLYAVLSDSAAAGRRAVSVEAPPELSLPGIVQVDVADLSGRWEAAVVAALRLDPDVLAVGEMHDAPTAQAAVQAALAGHTLLTTMHAASTAEVPVRLLQLGASPYALASSMNMIVAQRLVRKVCHGCAEPSVPEEQLLAALGLTQDDVEGWQLMRGRGCEACGGTGYSGRTACFELWAVDEQVRQLIVSQAPAGAFEELRRRSQLLS